MTDQNIRHRQAAKRSVLQRDRRNWRRVPLSLPVRMLDEAGQEIVSCTLDISAGGLLIETSADLMPGDKVVCYVDGVGRLPTTVVRRDGNQIALSSQATPQKRDRLGDQLTWILNREKLGMEEDRLAERKTGGGQVSIRRACGRVIAANVTDISLVGVALATSGELPMIGEKVTVGKKQGVVARYLPEGFAVDFTDRYVERKPEAEA